MKHRCCILLMVVLGLIITSSCKKDDNSPSNTVKDIDGNVYHTVAIGTQVWMVENLRTTKYNDGTAIPLVTDNAEWGALSTPGFCWNSSLPANKSTYGPLYNWFTVKTGKLCPSGWHVPTSDEWRILMKYLGGDRVAWAKLCEAGYAHWSEPEYEPHATANNESGFTGLPGGMRSSEGYSSSIGYWGCWWSSIEDRSYSAVSFLMGGPGFFGIGISTADKQDGLSVRCIKDE